MIGLIFPKFKNETARIRNGPGRFSYAESDTIRKVLEVLVTQKTIEAVYSGGVLRPVAKLEGFKENQRVIVTVTPTAGASPLAGWIGDMPDEDAREMIDIIEAEFEKVDPHEWK